MSEPCNCRDCREALVHDVGEWMSNHGLRTLLSENPKQRKGRDCPYCLTPIVTGELIAGHYGVRWGHPACVQQAFIHNRLLTSAFNTERRPNYLLSRLKKEMEKQKGGPFYEMFENKARPLSTKPYSMSKPELQHYNVSPPKSFAADMPLSDCKDCHAASIPGVCERCNKATALNKLLSADYKAMEERLAQFTPTQLNEWHRRFGVPAHMLGFDPAKPGSDKTVMTKLNRNGDEFAFVHNEMVYPMSSADVEYVRKHMQEVFGKGHAHPAEHINVEVKLRPLDGIRCPFFEPRLVGKVRIPGARRPYHTLQSSHDKEQEATHKLILKLLDEEQQRVTSHYLARTNEFPCCPEHGPAEFEMSEGCGVWEKSLWLVCRKAPQRLKEDLQKLLKRGK